MKDTELNSRYVEHFECQCTSDEHTLCFTYYEWEGDEKYGPELFTSVFLDAGYKRWYGRLWTAIKYIFGYKCKYGHFDCTILKQGDSERFLELAQKFHNQVQKYREKYPHVKS